MKTEQKLKLAISRLSELEQRRSMLIENGIPLRSIDEDIATTVAILDEILGSYSETKEIYEKIKDCKSVRIHRRYLEGLNYLLRANGLNAVLIEQREKSVNIQIERCP